jgi:hypothetical protein
MTDPRTIFIGVPETAADFEARARDEVSSRCKSVSRRSPSKPRKISWTSC